jgi:cytochrome c-type biogenesis protein CcmH/NrfG
MERSFCKQGASDEAGARADLEAAVTNEPTFAPAHFLLATHLAKAGETARAIAEYQGYVKLEPDTPNAKVARERIKLLQKRR